MVGNPPWHATAPIIEISHRRYIAITGLKLDMTRLDYSAYEKQATWYFITRITILFMKNTTIYPDIEETASWLKVQRQSDFVRSVIWRNL